MLVALDDDGSLFGTVLGDLTPAARALSKAPDGRRKEREAFDARIRELLAFHWFVPDDEPPETAVPKAFAAKQVAPPK